MMVTHLVSFQRRDDAGDLLFRSPLGKLRDLLRLAFPLQQCVQHQLPRGSENVRQYIAQLYVGILQDLLHAVLLRRAYLMQSLPPPRQIPQFSNRAGRYETRIDHGVAQQMRQPPAVLVVRLVALASLDFMWIGQVHLDAVFQHVEHGFPIRSRAFHHDMRDGFLAKPLTQSFQVGNVDAKPSFLDSGLPVEWSDHDTH